MTPHRRASAERMELVLLVLRRLIGQPMPNDAEIGALAGGMCRKSVQGVLSALEDTKQITRHTENSCRWVEFPDGSRLLPGRSRTAAFVAAGHSEESGIDRPTMRPEVWLEQAKALGLRFEGVRGGRMKGRRLGASPYAREVGAQSSLAGGGEGC